MTDDIKRIKLTALFAALFLVLIRCSSERIQFEDDEDEIFQLPDDDFFDQFPSYKESDNKKQCKTESCLHLEKVMNSKLDKSTAPCEDMYQYACGGMLKHSLTNRQRSESTFGHMYSKEMLELKKIIDGLKNRKEQEVYTKVYNWYSACMNKKQFNKLGTRPMVDLLESLGSWPIFNPKWKAEEWDLEKTLATVHRNVSVFPLFKITVGNDARNSSSLYHLAIQRTKLPLETPDFYLTKSKYSDRILCAYFNLLLTLTEFLGAKSCFQLKIDILNVIKFEIDLAKAMKLDKKHYLISPSTTLGSLRKAYEFGVFDWKRYFSYLYQDLPKQAPLEDSEIIYVKEVLYFKRVMKLIATSEPRVLANYVLAQVVFQYSGDLSEKLRLPYLGFYRAAYGIQAISPLWLRCIRSTTFHLNAAVSALYVKKTLPDKDLEKAKDLVHRLVVAYTAHLENIKWMDEKTKKAAEEKVRTMIEHVGYPEAIKNITVLEAGYKEVEVDPLTYFENVRKDYELTRKFILNLRGKKPNLKSWDMSYTVQNAQYTPSCNKIAVSAGLLQPPLFDSDYPSAINFGSIGMAVGHEMTHGFDATGSMFDKYGNVRLWWTKKTLNKFRKKTTCMAKQYSKFLVYGHHLNGNQTLNENIADNGGLRIAYEAYCQWLETEGRDSSLPTIDLTPKQLFFLSFSQTWCSKTTRQSSIYSLYTDEHSPSKARVNYVLSNMKEFSDAFQCDKGTPMNPAKKCIVW